jgi:hypothetical protein
MGSNSGSLYGLPKVHKEGFSMRPIISSIGTYNYKLAKYLDSLIKPLLENDRFMLKDSFEFVNNNSKVKNNNLYMVSVDVESLFRSWSKLFIKKIARKLTCFTISLFIILSQKNLNLEN